MTLWSNTISRLVNRHDRVGTTHNAGAAAISVCVLRLAILGMCSGAPAYAATTTTDLTELSLDELMNVEVTSVSKKAERLSDAATSIFVITQEDIRRSGYTSIPEILRLAPNLQVARVDSSQYAITARGFNSTTANKLLVLIDGRTVYTPLFSGVFWDVQDTLLEDIERIEVISGPGGTLWGSNAVNGVINITTRRSQDTKGGLVSLGAGTKERGAGMRYGAKLGEDATFRVYGKGFNRDPLTVGNGTGVQDWWNKGQVGFRADWSRGSDALTLQGDGYTGTIAQMWETISRSQAPTCSDAGTEHCKTGQPSRFRGILTGPAGLPTAVSVRLLDTYDIEAQHRFQVAARHEIVWGGGYRMMHDAVTNSAGLAFLPNVRPLTRINGFIQDSIALHERLTLTLGVKLETNSYSGLEVQPNVRLAWKFRDDALLWSAISRAVRTPSRLDTDLFAPGQAPFLLAGGPNFKAERLIAYEVGYRMQPTPQMSFSISTFYNMYDNLRSIEPGPGGALPFTLTNKMKGYTYGVETWGSYRVFDWWRMSAGYNYIKEKLGFESDSRDSNTAAHGNDPSHQFSARSAVNVARNLDWDLGLRVIGALESPDVPNYVALDTRIGWTFMKGAELSLIGYNLLDHNHPEFGLATNRSEPPRAFYAKFVWSY